MALHFVGVKHPAQGYDSTYETMVRRFGVPDFVHRHWDVRARQEIVPGDVAVFAKGSEADEPRANAYDDSANV